VNFPHGIACADQIMKIETGIGVVERPLTNPAIDLREGDPARFGFLHHLADCLLQQIAIYSARDSSQETQLPLGTGQPRDL